jgi:hypothetical protein
MTGRCFIRRLLLTTTAAGYCRRELGEQGSGSGLHSHGRDDLQTDSVGVRGHLEAQEAAALPLQAGKLAHLLSGSGVVGQPQDGAVLFAPPEPAGVEVPDPVRPVLVGARRQHADDGHRLAGHAHRHLPHVALVGVGPQPHAVGVQDVTENPGRDCAEARDVAQAHLDTVRDKLRELQALERTLADFVETCTAACAGGPADQCVILEDLHHPEPPKRSACCG